MSDVERILLQGAGHVHPMAGQRFGGYGTRTTTYTLNAPGPAYDPRRQRLDATLGIFTLTMPATPADGEVWMFYEVAGLATAITIDGNGRNINGAGTFTFNVAYRARAFIYDSTADAWFIFWSNGV